MHHIGGGRMLQSRVPKIYGGSSRCAKYTKHANSRGSGGIFPRKV